MVPFSTLCFLLYSHLLLHFALASPVSNHIVARAGTQSIINGLLCLLFGDCNNDLREPGTIVNVSTVIGSAAGVADNDAVRFSVKYASADRWQASEVASNWELP